MDKMHIRYRLHLEQVDSDKFSLGTNLLDAPLRPTARSRAQIDNRHASFDELFFGIDLSQLVD